MIARVIENEAQRFAEHLARLCPKGRADAMMNAVIESGGVYQHPPESRRVLFEINYLEIRTSALSEQSAIQSWIRKARGASAQSEDQKKVFIS